MPSVQKMLKCDRCGRMTMHIGQHENSVLHLLLSIITFGFWLIIWFLIAANREHPQCTVCGMSTETPNAAKGCLIMIIVFIAMIPVISMIKSCSESSEPYITFSPENSESSGISNKNVIKDVRGNGWRVRVETEPAD